jgi:CBS domain-containing protein
VLTLKRSILTEKISRRGYHLSREYALDPLEILFVREVMRTIIVVLPSDGTLEEAHRLIHSTDSPKGQHLFPVLDSNSKLIGVVTRNQLVQLYQRMPARAPVIRLSEIATEKPLVAFADEPLRTVVNRMAESGFTRFPVLDASGEGKIIGMVALNDLLHARTRNLADERARERVLRIRMPFGRRQEESKISLGSGTHLRDGSTSKFP